MRFDLSLAQVVATVGVISTLLALIVGGLGGWYAARIDHETRLIRLEVWIGNVPGQPVGPAFVLPDSTGGPNPHE